MKHTKRLLVCCTLCMALFFFNIPAFAQEVSAGDISADSQTTEVSSAPQPDLSSSNTQPESKGELPQPSPVQSETPASVPVITPPASSVQPQAPSQPAASRVPAVTSSFSAESTDSMEESSSEEASSEEPSSQVPSQTVVESGDVSLDPLQGGTLSDGGDASRLYGLIAWIAIGIVAIVLLVVLIFSKRNRGNQMSSGRAYARKRSARYKRKRLLDDKYYQNLKRK